jgi:hypothetical protein
MTYKIANEKVGITEKGEQSRRMQINVYFWFLHKNGIHN